LECCKIRQTVRDIFDIQIDPREDVIDEFDVHASYEIQTLWDNGEIPLGIQSDELILYLLEVYSNKLISKELYDCCVVEARIRDAKRKIIQDIN
jgi:hypothetical protein